MERLLDGGFRRLDALDGRRPDQLVTDVQNGIAVSAHGEIRRAPGLYDQVTIGEVAIAERRKLLPEVGSEGDNLRRRVGCVDREGHAVSVRLDVDCYRARIVEEDRDLLVGLVHAALADGGERHNLAIDGIPRYVG